MSEKSDVIIADCEKQELDSFLAAFHYKNKVFSIKSHISNWKRTGIFSEIRRYAKYFAVPIGYFFSRKKYDTIIGWQQFYALIFCFYCSLFKVKKVNTVVALNFTYKEKSGKLGGLYKRFMKRCVSSGYLDRLHVPSAAYADTFSAEFGFAREHIIVSPFGIPDCIEKYGELPAPQEVTRDKYALAIGRSNRDYDFLIDAWQGIDYPLIIISDTYTKTTDNPNIKIFTDIAGEESYPWIANCGVMIIPIADGSICSGDTVLLTAMSLKRRIIVTAPSTLAEMYVKNAENALLIKKAADELRDRVLEVLGSDKFENLGQKARESYLAKFSRAAMADAVSEALRTK